MTGPSGTGEERESGPAGPAGLTVPSPTGGEPATPPRTGDGTVARIIEAARLAVRAAPGRLALYVVVTLVSAALPVGTAWLTRAIVNGLTGDSSLGEPALLAGALGATVLGSMALTAAGTFLRAEVEREIGALAKERLFTAVARIRGLAPFEDPAFLDRLQLADESGGRGPNRVIEGLLGVSRSALTISGLLGLVSALSPLMAVIVLLSGVPVLAAELLLGKHRAAAFWEITPAERREIFYRDLLATERAAKEVRLLGLGGFVRGRMLAERRAHEATQRRVDRREFAVRAGLGLVGVAVLVPGLVWAVAAARAGRLSVGDVAMFITAVMGVQAALGGVAQDIARAHESLLLFRHYLTVLRGVPDLPVAVRPAALPPLRRGIELRDVWFRYSEGHPWVLRGVNLVIPYGRAVALVGLNGAGKSTLVKLLCRFYDPTRGAVLWDGVDIREADPDALRGRISAVFQDYMDYELTAAENVGVGDLDALHDQDRVEAAARRAGVHETLAALPDGYRTLLSRRFTSDVDREAVGVGLSGGQRQRVALARAFMRADRDLVILDEPSAGLDAAAEHEVHTSLKEYRNGLTSLLISHRLGAVRDADRIVVLSGGVVVEEGSHDELVAAGGEYARLFTLQASGYRSRTVV
ncbi:ABC transporter ATP-binding protein [Streptosporangium sandarakinum]|uniref:ABC transporter ATP-binding protein n=1 Tax=Streptosporangium sandarakinum TaxID=1260955 RepID=UPI0037B3EDB9